MSSANFELVGDKELQLTLHELGSRGAQRIMLPAVRSGLVPIRKDAKARARAQFRNNTLSKLVTSKAGRTRSGDVYGKVYVSPDKPQHTIKIDGREVPVAVAANIQEYGRKDGSLAPHPFIRPAGDTQKPAALSALTARARLELTKYAARLAARSKTGR